MPLTDAGLHSRLSLRPNAVGEGARSRGDPASRPVQSRHGARRLRARFCGLAICKASASRRLDTYGRTRLFGTRTALIAASGNVVVAGGRLVDPSTGIDAISRRSHSRRYRRRDRRTLRSRTRTRSFVDAREARSSRPGSSTCTCICANPGFPKRKRSRPAPMPPCAADLPRLRACPTPNRRWTIPDDRTRRRCGGRRPWQVPRVSDRRDHARPPRTRAVRLRALPAAGAVAFSDDGTTVADTELLVRAALSERVPARRSSRIAKTKRSRTAA